MGVLITWLGSGFASVIAYFGLDLTKKVLLRGAAVTAVIAIFTALAIVIKALLVGIVYTLPSWAAAGAVILPSNLAVCISAVISAKLAVFIVRTKFAVVKILAGNG